MCLHNLKVAGDLGSRRVEMETDSEEAMQLIRDGDCEFHMDKGLIDEIHGMLLRDCTVNITQVKVSRWLNFRLLLLQRGREREQESKKK